MRTCAATGDDLIGEAWSVNGIRGTYCTGHAIVLDLGQQLTDALGMDHPFASPILDAIADAVAKPCPTAAVAPEPIEDIGPVPPLPELPAADDETEEELLARLMPGPKEPSPT